MIGPEELAAGMDQHTGSETAWKHWLGITYTDGVKWLADEAEAHWLIDAIGSYQQDPKITKDPMLKEFQCWMLEVRENKSCSLICLRDTRNEAFRQEIEYTSFPFGVEIKLYLTNNMLLLPSEN